VSRKAKWFSSVALTLALVACGDDKKPDDDGDDDEDAGTKDDAGGGDAGDDWKTLDYSKDEHWACKGRDDDECSKIDLTLAEKKADGTYESVAVERAKDPKVDCFYLYPSVDDDEDAVGFIEDVSDVEPVVTRLRNQGARFGSLCRLFVPLYRQMKLGTYKLKTGYASSEYFEHAYRDVEAAFDHYLEQDNDGRPFILIGHSQGTHTLVRLVQDRIEKEDALRKKMAGALLVGAVGAIHVPKGKRVGGTFKKVELCEGDDIGGCVVAFDSKAGGDETVRNPVQPIPEGMERACVSPSTLAGGTDNILSLSVFERDSGMIVPDSVMEPFVAYPQSTTAECEEDGLMALNEWADSPTKASVSPQIVNSVLKNNGAKNGMHSTDYNYAMGDLLRIVQAQIDAI
jgi:hypothetical protein